jgi:hypothetical protein
MERQSHNLNGTTLVCLLESLKNITTIMAANTQFIMMGSHKANEPLVKIGDSLIESILSYGYDKKELLNNISTWKENWKFYYESKKPLVYKDKPQYKAVMSA